MQLLKPTLTIYGVTIFGNTVFGVTIYGIMQYLQPIYCMFGELYTENCDILLMNISEFSL